MHLSTLLLVAKSSPSCFSTRCDVEFPSVKTMRPAICESVFTKDYSKELFYLMEMGLQKIQQGFSDATLVRTVLRDEVQKNLILYLILKLRAGLRRQLGRDGRTVRSPFEEGRVATTEAGQGSATIPVQAKRRRHGTHGKEGITPSKRSSFW